MDGEDKVHQRPGEAVPAPDARDQAHSGAILIGAPRKTSEGSGAHSLSAPSESTVTDSGQTLDHLAAMLAGAPHSVRVVQQMIEVIEDAGGEVYAELKRLAKRHSTSTALLLMLAVIADQAGDRRAANRWLRLLLDVHPDDALGWLNRADAHRLKGDGAAVRVEYDRAVEAAPEQPWVYALRAELLFDQGEYDAAQSDYRKVIDLAPDAEDGYLGCARVAMALKRYAEAADVLRTGLERRPTSLQLVNDLGVALAGQEKPKKALELFNRAVTMAPNNPDTYYNRGQVHLLLRDFGAALKDFTQLIKKLPDQPDGFVLRGKLFEAQGDTGRALREYMRIVKRWPTEPLGYELRAKRYRAQERFREAAQEYDRLLQMAPENAEAYRSRGVIEFERGQFDRALADFTKALSINDRDPWFYLGRAEANAALNRLEDALSDFEQMALLAPDASNVHRRIGDLRYLQGDLKRSRVAYERAIARDATDIDALFGLAQVHFDLGNYQQVLECLNRAVEFGFELPDVYFLRGDTHFALQHFELALLDFDRVTALASDEPEGYWGRGRVFEEQKGYEQAAKEYGETIERLPDHPAPYVARGRMFFYLSQYEPAGSDLDRAIALDPNDPVARTLRGMLREQQGKYPDSYADFEAAACLSPNNPRAHSKVGDALINLSAYDRAVVAFDRSLELQPNEPDTLVKKADAFLLWANEGGGPQQAEDAVATAEAALALNPKLSVAHAIKGAALATLGRYDTAIAALDEALKYDPDDAWTLARKGEVLYRGGAEQQAVKVFRSLRRRHADLMQQATVGEALVLRRLGRARDALRVLERALGEVPPGAEAYLGRVYLLYAFNDPDAWQLAVEDCRTAISLDPGLADAYNMLAWIQAEKLHVRLEESTEAAEKAVALREDGNFLDTLGWVWYRRGDLRKARRYLRRALTLLEPDILIRSHLAIVEQELDAPAIAV